MTTYTKGGQIRTAETPAQEVALQFDGWRQARPADPDPPAAELVPEPAPDTDAPSAGGKTGGRQTGTRGGAKNSG